MYDPAHISSYYDAYGEREWERFDDSAAGRVSLHIHLHYLRKFIRAGEQVLDAGAGSGRFAIEMAKMGAWITVGDISPVQIELNRRRVAEAGGEMDAWGSHLRGHAGEDFPVVASKVAMPCR